MGGSVWCYHHGSGTVGMGEAVCMVLGGEDAQWEGISGHCVHVESQKSEDVCGDPVLILGIIHTHFQMT